jgi:spore maturation protein CgeB
VSRPDPPYEPAANVPGDDTPIDTSAFGGPRLLQHDLVRMFSRSRLSLGFATAGESHLAARRLRHLRLREFEAPMSGALYLTEDQQELSEYFTPGQEVLTYTDRDDLLDKARYYLAHQEQAERIRRAGFERARREHTWQHRFADLFTALGLPSTLNSK